MGLRLYEGKPPQKCGGFFTWAQRGRNLSGYCKLIRLWTSNNVKFKIENLK